MRMAFPWWLTRLARDIEIAVVGYWRKQQAWRDFCRMPKNEFDLGLSPDPAASLYMSDEEFRVYRAGLIQKRQALHSREEANTG